MEIKASDVAKLRQMTGAGMMDCKKALVEAEGDFNRAQEIIREKGKLVAGLSHTMHVLLTLKGTTLLVVGIHNLSSQLVGHSLATTLTSEQNHILHADTLLAVGNIRINFFYFNYKKLNYCIIH